MLPKIKLYSCVEDETFGKTDFFLTDNYVLRLGPLAIKKLLEQLRLSFSSRVRYKQRSYSWDTVIQLKGQELGRYLLHKDNELDFINPQLDFNTVDSKIVRDKMISMTVSNARKIGIGKSTLWYLHRRAQANRPLKTYRKVTDRICV
jgi:hypothetical protein